MTEIDQLNELGRTEVREYLPERLLLNLADDVPERVDYATCCHVGNAFFWAKPAHLRVANQIATDLTNS